ncbi:hypothetical protein NKJ66_07290 [Mesorhizobium sp. M0078]|uniref:hypothetical protein n=1 Tax=Mesorhizobium sp. M0078 TaxID=2956871 RepID=UPI00333A5F8B
MKDEKPPAESVASKASFKLSLIETVAADPKLQPSDLSLMVAYLAFLTWPARTSYLTTTAARARTGLSERQISTSRGRLLERDYLVDTETVKYSSKVFHLENPRAVEIIDHVAYTVEYLKEKMAVRQADRRRLARVVPAEIAETDEAMSHAPGECDVPAAIAGNIPSVPPQEVAMKEEEPIKVSSVPSNGYAAAKDNDLHIPFPAPASEEELAEEMATLFVDCALSPLTMSRMRTLLATGRLTPAIVQGQRIEAA